MVELKYGILNAMINNMNISYINIQVIIVFHPPNSLTLVINLIILIVPTIQPI